MLLSATPFLADDRRISSLVKFDDRDFDVIVAGGGPAGMGAAVAASDCGAKTLLLEASSLMGGIAASALWMAFNRVVLDGVSKEWGPRGGVHDKFVREVRKYGGEACSERRHPATDRRGGLHIHPEYLRLAIFDLLESSNCYYRLYSPVCGVIKDNSRVCGVKVQTKDGVTEYTSKIVIDCTGDGDVANYAGVEMQKGRETDGRFMPGALLWSLFNVDTSRLYQYWILEENRDSFMEKIKAAKEEGYVTCPWYDFDEGSLDGVVNVNNTGVDDWGNLDLTNPADRTYAERLGIQAAIDFTNLVRIWKIPGLENCQLMRAGYQVSARDSRRIVGEYLITDEDAIKAPEFDDIVSRRYGFIDAAGYCFAEMASGHAYPYRCLVPKAVDNLLVAGRCASATHLGFASGRGMGECLGMGQAAGVAAAESIKQKQLPRNVDIKKVQEILRAWGVKL